MKLMQASIGTIITGVVLLVISFVWPLLVPQSAVWSESEAIAYEEASATFHKLSFSNVSEQELDEAKQAYEAEKAKLDRAVTARNTVPQYIRYVAYAVMLVGGGMFAVARGNEN